MSSGRASARRIIGKHPLGKHSTSCKIKLMCGKERLYLKIILVSLVVKRAFFENSFYRHYISCLQMFPCRCYDKKALWNVTKSTWTEEKEREHRREIDVGKEKDSYLHYDIWFEPNKKEIKDVPMSCS
ncbi:hypothetical protein L6452_32485 [Arctium lappa]|uniref:Uncharacterized protein n=1 Tax=Arctium lappa TaxID=4217 RepID=A0ACB8Z5Z3_ARCLA|nr:hypothetical protein L6452_32485 [Arctium lappa]